MGVTMNITDAHEAHDAILDAGLDHMDEHAAYGTPMGSCCDAYARAEEHAWLALLEAEASHVR